MRWVLPLLVACSPVNEPGDPFAPTVPARVPSTTAPPPAAPSEPEPRPEPSEQEGETKDPVALQAALLGIEPDDAPPRQPEPESLAAEPALVPPAPVVAPEVAPAAVPTAWDPTAEPPWLGDWGIRLISTTVTASPPRAMIGLPDGTELVVKAGSLLPEVGVVVLAVGTGRIQIAEIEPAGDHARVRTRTVSALYAPAPGE